MEERDRYFLKSVYIPYRAVVIFEVDFTAETRSTIDARKSRFDSDTLVFHMPFILK
jgi:hypothetical protein